MPVPDAIAEKAFAIFLDFVTAYAEVLAQVRANERCVIEGSILRIEDYGDDRVHQQKAIGSRVILSILKFKEVISFNSVARVFIFKGHGLRAIRCATSATAIRIDLVRA